MARVKGLPEDLAYRRQLDALHASQLRRGARVGLSGPKRVLKIVASHPSIIGTQLRMLVRNRRAVAARARLEHEGLLIPHLILLTISTRCNLACPGCYMRDRPVSQADEMTLEELRSLVGQARELGVASIVVLGGEPLVRRHEVFDLARTFRDFPFLLFTNGLLIDDDLASELGECSNVVPFVSFEGPREETDARRGDGVFERLLEVCALLREHVPLFGCAVTVTRENFDVALGDQSLHMLVGTGARVVALIPFVPMQEGTDGLVLTPAQKREMIERIPDLERRFSALFVPVPGDVEVFGGCLAAGRGFVHVSPGGDLEPCAMVPFSDANLKTVPLREALGSPFLTAVRRNAGKIRPDGHCALRTRPDWVRELHAGRRD